MEELKNISPYVRAAMHLRVWAPWRLDPRIIFDYHLVFLAKGSLKVRIKDKIFYAQQGDILFFKPGEEHETVVLDKVYNDHPHLHFDMIEDELSPQIKVCFKKFEHLTDYEKTLIRPDITSSGELYLPHLIRLKNTTYFENMLYDIIDEYNNKMPYYQMRIKGKLVTLLAYLYTAVYEQNNIFSPNSNEMKHMKEYIAANIDRSLTLEELSAKYNMHERALIRKFKKTFLITPMHYHKMLRFEKAREMLQYTNKTIDEIAAELGFSSAMVFSRAFKSFDGVPPSYYRNR